MPILIFKSLKLEVPSAAHPSSITFQLPSWLTFSFHWREAFIYSRRTTYSSVTCYLPTHMWERRLIVLGNLTRQHTHTLSPSLPFSPIWQNDLTQQLSCRLAATPGKLYLRPWITLLFSSPCFLLPFLPPRPPSPPSAPLPSFPHTLCPLLFLCPATWSHALV